MIGSYLLAKFTGSPRDGGKERNLYEKGETNEREKRRFPKSRSSSQQAPNLKIETYQRQIPNSNESFRQWARQRKLERLSWFAGRDAVKTISWTPDSTMWRQTEVVVAILEWPPKSGLTSDVSQWGRTPWRSMCKIYNNKCERKVKVCCYSLSSQYILFFFVLLTRSTQEKHIWNKRVSPFLTDNKKCSGE